MSKSERELAEIHEARDALRAQVTHRISRVRGAVAERSLGRRAADEVVDRGTAAANKAVDVLSEKRWLVAGIAAAAGAWFARQPLSRLSQEVVAQIREFTPEQRDKLLDWVKGVVKR